MKARLAKHPFEDLRQWIKERARKAVQEVVYAARGGYELVRIPAGAFMMGSPPSEEGRFEYEDSVHEVRVPEFCFKIPLTPFVKGGKRRNAAAQFRYREDGPERRNPLQKNSFHRDDPAWALLIGSWCSTGSFGGCNRVGATRGFFVNEPLSALLSLCRPVVFPLLSRPEDFSQGRWKTKCCSETP